jgi:RES domain
VWFHVYRNREYPTEADTFAQGWGSSRFAPISTKRGSPVHTYYVASTPEAAYMESVLHEIPLFPPGVLNVSELQYFHLAQVTLPDPLTLVSFHTPYLPQLGLTRAQLIDSLPACYRETRPWAEAAYQQQPTAQAIGYGSHRDDSARCLMLFGQRLPKPSLIVLKTEPLSLPPRRQEVLALARSLKIREI